VTDIMTTQQRRNPVGSPQDEHLQRRQSVQTAVAARAARNQE
jgi:hypothetical protein